MMNEEPMQMGIPGLTFAFSKNKAPSIEERMDEQANPEPTQKTSKIEGDVKIEVFDILSEGGRRDYCNVMKSVFDGKSTMRWEDKVFSSDSCKIIVSWLENIRIKDESNT